MATLLFVLFSFERNWINVALFPLPGRLVVVASTAPYRGPWEGFGAINAGSSPPRSNRRLLFIKYVLAKKKSDIVGLLACLPQKTGGALQDKIGIWQHGSIEILVRLRELPG